MIRLRKIAPMLALFALPIAFYQFFFFFARQPLNDALIEAVKHDDLATVAPKPFKFCFNTAPTRM